MTGMQFAGGYAAGGGQRPDHSGSGRDARRVDPGARGNRLTLTGGALVKRDAGILILSGVNTYSGGTMVREGVVQVSAGIRRLAAAASPWTAAPSLRGRRDQRARRHHRRGRRHARRGQCADLSGAMGGTGALTKAGPGTLVLSGNSWLYRHHQGPRGHPPDGTLGGALMIPPGARLSGTGSSAVIFLRAIVAPGTSPGTLTVTGDATFRAGSSFVPELAAGGGTDRSRSRARDHPGRHGAVTALDPEPNM